MRLPAQLLEHRRQIEQHVALNHAGRHVHNLDARRRHSERARVLEETGATLMSVEGENMTAAVRALGQHGVQSLLIEGGATLHQAAWDEGIVDYVQLYVAPILLGSRGPALLPGRAFAPASLSEQKVRREKKA